MEIISESIITCPHCVHQKKEEMPTNACPYFYECDNCKTVIKPLPGDCCVLLQLWNSKVPAHATG